MSTVTDQNLLSPELTRDPFAYYAGLRASDPVHWAPASKAWLCSAIVALDRHPAELARLRAEPSLVNRAVEEVLRSEGPIKILIRWVVQDHERDGRPVSAGDRVFPVLQS